MGQKRASEKVRHGGIPLKVLQHWFFDKGKITMVVDIRLKHLQSLPMRDNNLMLLGRAEVAVRCACDSCRTLKRQVVEEHIAVII